MRHLTHRDVEGTEVSLLITGEDVRANAFGQLNIPVEGGDEIPDDTLEMVGFANSPEKGGTDREIDKGEETEHILSERGSGVRVHNAKCPIHGEPDRKDWDVARCEPGGEGAGERERAEIGFGLAAERLGDEGEVAETKLQR
jgi:hypothetical protein